jgi:hypothetical protein
VLIAGGRLTMILVSQTKAGFNAAYSIASRLAPAFWGRQIDRHLISLLPRHGFALHRESYVTQIFYVSHIVSVIKTRH